MLQPKLKEYQIAIPQTALVPGKNRLEFRYAYVGAPADVEKGPKDRRRLAVAWDYIRLDTPRKQPRADAQSGTLHIPFGAQVDYYFKLAGESILTLDGLTWTGDSRGRLRLILQPAGEREQVLRNLGRSGKFQAVPLTGTAGQIVRLSLGAISPSRNHSDSDGMTLVRPAIRPKEFQQTAQDAPAPRAQPSKGSTRPNIVLYLVDALRADHLGCYGYHKPVSPNIDEFAENATVFENALAQAPWTKPSAASIFTGMYPRTHGVIKRRDALPAEATTLAEILQAEGYNTATFIANGYLGKKFGLHRGFADVVSLPRARSDQINQKVFAWLDKRGHQQPFFLYIHTLDPHAPYSPPRDFRERFAGAVRQPNLTEETRALLASLQKRYGGPIEVGSVPWMQALHRKRIPVTKILIADLVSLYDAEIASNDHNFGIFLQELRRRRLFEESLIILVSDHGESFYEHGTWEHGENLHREVIHVPLIAKFPSSYTAANATKRRIPDLVQQIDILPTILDSLGLVVPENVDGRSLVPLISGKEEKKRQRRAFSYLEVRSWWAGSVIEGAWKLIQHSGRKSSVQLFNLEEGPGEDKNVFDEHPIVASYLLSLVKAQEQGRQTLKPGKAVIDKDLREQLKALGYVQ
jgi:arylsulfatase A-like enzyme